MLSEWTNVCVHAASSRLRKPATTLRRKAFGRPSWVSLSAAKKGPEERGLRKGSGSASRGPGPPLPLPTPVHVVDLGHTAQLAVEVTLEHHLQSLVLDAPGGGVRHAGLAPALKRRDAVLMLGEQVHGQEARGQGSLA